MLNMLLVRNELLYNSDSESPAILPESWLSATVIVSELLTVALFTVVLWRLRSIDPL